MSAAAVFWSLGVGAALVVGVAAQLLIWWHGDRSAVAALTYAPALWVFYLLVGVRVGEGIQRRLAIGIGSNKPLQPTRAAGPNDQRESARRGPRG